MTKTLSKKVPGVPAAQVIVFPGQVGAKFSQGTHSEEKKEPEKIAVEKTTQLSQVVQLAGQSQPLATTELMKDLATLSVMALRAKYAREANSHRNMLTRAPKKGGVVAAEFKDFRSFLANVGVIPGPGLWTLDRINNENPDYGPGLVRWATPKIQNNNKGDTAFLNVDGQVHPLTTWAELTGQDPNTLRARRKKGWSDREVVHGRNGKPGDIDSDPSAWSSLLVGHVAQYASRMEAVYQRHKRRLGPRIVDPRSLWLAAVAEHTARYINAQIIEILAEAEYNDVDPKPYDELEVKYANWRATRERAIRAFEMRATCRYIDLPSLCRADPFNRRDPER